MGARWLLTCLPVVESPAHIHPKDIMNSRRRKFPRAVALALFALAACETNPLEPPVEKATEPAVQAAVAHNQSNTFSAPGNHTYVVPAGIEQLDVDLWGASGANGTGSSLAL